MAHILVAYKQFPAPSVGHAGGESLFGLMKALRLRGHRLTLVARIAADERQHLPDTAAICEAVYTAPHHRTMRGPRVLAFVRSYLLFRATLRRAMKEVQPDLLHVETTQTAVVALGLKRPPASYRTQDINWFLVEQRLGRLKGLRCLLARLQRVLLRRAEPWIASCYDVVLAISEGDRSLLSEAMGGATPLLVPLAPTLSANRPVAPAVEGGPNLLFVGAMSRDHNHQGAMWFLDCVWPQVVAQRPDARLYIVGGGPQATLVSRADGEHVFVTGFVDDLAPWYRAATVFVSPLLVAGGLLQKVIDAMVMGVPVVATTVCNHGLGAVPGTDLITADDPGAFAGAVLSLLNSAEDRTRMGEAGRAFVTRTYDIDAAVARWDAAIRGLTA